MGDGIIEDLQSEVSDLRSAVTALCRRAGHEWQEWRIDWCRLSTHEKRVQHEIRHRIKCEVCGAWKCEEGDE